MKLIAFLILLPAAHAATDCAGLKTLALPHAAITAAEERSDTGRPAYCRVAVTLTPSADSDIKMEIWLPSAWNGKFLANGNGGWSGSIQANTLANGVGRGYASAMTDTGHSGGSASFALGHPEKLIDFGYRSAHEMVLASRAIVTAFYGSAAKLNYWSGCSAGGRQGLMEAQRYPADFDGIIAGAPGLNWTGRAIESMVIANASHQDEAAYIPPAKYALIHNAVLEACDALDGVKDGVLENPARCNFNPARLKCPAEDGPTCLTAKQVETVHAIYNPTDFYPGYMRGSELGWATMAGPRPFAIGLDLFRYVVFANPDWNFLSFQFPADAARAEKLAAPALNATNPDIQPFLSRGGKLIQYHGWSDPQIAPGFSVTYYQKVLAKLGGSANVTPSYRLFMVPGMAHCGGGDGTAQFDMLTALEQWVEAGKAPDSIPAARVRNGSTERTRPLCPYPQVAVYKGSGSAGDAANFACKTQ